MPVTLLDIEQEIARRDMLMEIDAQLERQSLDSWPQFRGAAAYLMSLVDAPARPRELMIAGPAETGKTWACCWFVDFVARLYPGAQITICRKLRSTMDGTILNTWRKVIAIRGGVEVYGGEKPEWYDFANGSRVWIAGLDNPGKALSSERDFVYVNQAEDLDRDDWQTLKTRTTGRGAVAPWTLLLGDCNPGPPTHWIINRAALKVVESRHEDNPSLYTAEGELTEQGVLTMADLEALEGVLKERLRFGRWVAAEGTVYTFDKRLHVVDEMPAGWETWRKIRAIDFGFTNPFVCLWIAIDPDGRLYVYRQLYMTERTVDQHVITIQQVEQWYLRPDDLERLVEPQRASVLAQCLIDEQLASALGLDAGDLLIDEHAGWLLDKTTRKPIPSPYRERVSSSVADHDAEDRATLASHHIVTVPAKKAISPGIQAVQKRLRRAADKKPRLFVLSNCLVERDERLAKAHQPTCLEEEFDLYAWPKGADGKPHKEVPIDLYNHGLDAIRYAVMLVDKLAVSIIR